MERFDTWGGKSLSINTIIQEAGRNGIFSSWFRESLPNKTIVKGESTLVGTMTTTLNRPRYSVVMNSGLCDHCNKVSIVMKIMGPRMASLLHSCTVRKR